jgi:hypothetical protein
VLPTALHQTALHADLNIDYLSVGQRFNEDRCTTVYSPNPANMKHASLTFLIPGFFVKNLAVARGFFTDSLKITMSFSNNNSMFPVKDRALV